MKLRDLSGQRTIDLVCHMSRVKFSLRLLLTVVFVSCAVAAVAGRRVRYAVVQRDTIQKLSRSYQHFVWDTEGEVHGIDVSWSNANEVRYVIFALESPLPCDIALIRNFNGLRTLGFSGYVPTIDQIRSIPYMASVNSLFLSGSDSGIDLAPLDAGAFLLLTDRLPAMSRLEVLNMRVTGESMQGLGRAQSLRELVLSNVTFDDDLLQEIVSLHELSDLTIDQTSLPDAYECLSDRDVQQLSTHSGLRRITLVSRGLSKQCVRPLATMKSLEYVELGFGSQDPTKVDRDEIHAQLSGVRVKIRPVDMYGEFQR